MHGTGIEINCNCVFVYTYLGELVLFYSFIYPDGFSVLCNVNLDR